MDPSRLLRLPYGLLALLAVPAAAQLPYNPTRILQSPHNSQLLYLFQQPASSSSNFTFQSLSLKKTLSPTNLPYTTLSSALPFLNGTQSFTPIIDSDGNITVYTGNCTLGADGGELWRFTPTAGASKGEGRWTQASISQNKLGSGNNVGGGNYLASGISFSSVVKSDDSTTNVYVFGGMCPWSNSTTDTWTSSADYSNSMLELDPSSTAGSTQYALSQLSSRGPPIAEAGFSLTPLTATYSNNSDGSQNQQQNFVLLGGHTQSAFINMSQAALFSLPQETWTFLPVQQPTDDHTDLTVRDAVEVEPRSGHSAVLSPDGNRIILYGGWVSDTNTPASPQMAILEIGNGYGGQGDWIWKAPSVSAQNAPKANGLYGHGATMLPGGVMMIIGGYQISGSGSKSKRSTPIANQQAYFYNITSNTWLSQYTVPETSVTSDTPSTGNGSHPKSSSKTGLAIGIAVGVAVLLGLLVFWFWYTRHRRVRRANRDKELKDLAAGAQRFSNEELALGQRGIDGRGGGMATMTYGANGIYNAYFTDQGPPQPGWRATNGRNTSRTGLHVEIPSPTRGLRRGAPSRGNYQHVPRGSGNIHPIIEKDEEGTVTPAPENESGSKPKHLSTATTPDPFNDPDAPSSATDGRRPKSRRLSAADERRAEVKSWVSDWKKAGGAIRHGNEPESPTKSDRTGSNLSEHSARSNLSAHTRSTGLPSLTRSILNPFGSPQLSPTDEDRQYSFRNSKEHPRPSGSSGRDTAPKADADSFQTAKTSFAKLQAEGEALLGGRPDKADAGNESSEEDFVTRPGASNRLSWVGSVRRAIGRSITTGARASSMTQQTTSIFDKTPFPSGPASPEKEEGSVPAATELPRRAVSDASFWRSKRGAKDWGVTDSPVAEKTPKTDEWGVVKPDRNLSRESVSAETEGDDWDVEAAVESRVVQVMFTIPKTRLRVVNADAESRSLMSQPSSANLKEKASKPTLKEKQQEDTQDTEKRQ